VLVFGGDSRRNGTMATCTFLEPTAIPALGLRIALQPAYLMHRYVTHADHATGHLRTQLQAMPRLNISF
jgi:hypothetical protein